MFGHLTVSSAVSIPAGFSDALRPYLEGNTPPFTGLVSIPAGFSDALRHRRNCAIFSSVSVSIPAGFSDALRHIAYATERIAYQEFQSLLGFLMRCDMLSIRGFSVTIISFNPCWVF